MKLEVNMATKSDLAIMQWVIGIGFTILTIMMSLSMFFQITY